MNQPAKNVLSTLFPCVSNELSKIRHAISIHECVNCIESHYLYGDTKPIDATFLRRSPALAEKIWNATNFPEIWRH